MKKITEIGDFLIVSFSDHEQQEWASTGLGKYGVIDIDLYTGSIGIDRSVMEYDSAETIREALEQAFCLKMDMEVSTCEEESEWYM